jgi:mRNA-degrading endonuclease RelE of RelBE toxin-antitoxin system
MRFEIIFASDAIEDFRRLNARTRAAVRDAVETHLRYEPTRVSRSRIKRLRGLRQPQYRLRVEEVRVFYDVLEGEVHVVAVVEKSRSAEWLKTWGVPE